MDKTHCKQCGDSFKANDGNNPQCIEGIITKEDQLCSECGHRILLRQYDLGITNESAVIVADSGLLDAD